MKALFDEVSYTCSQHVTRTYSTSFSLAVRMLSPKIRSAILAIYGFVRFADEIVDSFHDYNQEELFNEFEVELEKALTRKISLNPILNAFQDVVHRYKIDRELINAFMQSMRADLDKQSYDTVEEYNAYIYGSADVVGLMCLMVFVNGNKQRYEELKHAAMKLGSAFQKVNFLRDFKDDMYTLNRSYFPNIKGSSLTTEDKAEIIRDIQEDFKEAYKGILALPIEAKFGVYTAYVYYSKLLHKLERVQAEELKQSRIRISNSLKMGLLAKSYLSYKMNLL